MSNVEKKRYILISYFNSNNIGDILLSNILYKQLAPHIDLVTCSFEGDFVNPCDWVYHYKAFTRVKNKIPGKSRCFMNKLKKELKKADGIIIGGGNMLMDISTYSTISLFRTYCDLAIEYKKKIIIPFVGIGPFTDLTVFNSLVPVLNRCAYISTRDKRSYQYIEEFNIDNKFISYDPAFLLPMNLDTKKSGLLINVINPETFDASQYHIYLKLYIDIISKILELLPNKRISLVVTTIADLKIAREVAQNVKSITKNDLQIFKPSNSRKLIEIVANSEFAIGARMHFLIIAYTQQIPIIGLKWQDKIGSFFENIGLQKYCQEISPSSANDILNLIAKKDFEKIYIDHPDRKKEIIKDINTNIERILKICSS